MMSAEDRYLVELYRGELKETFDQLQRENGFIDNPEAPLYYVGQVDHIHNKKKLGVKPSPVAWRLSPISTTRLAAWIALLTAISWSSWIIFALRSSL